MAANIGMQLVDEPAWPDGVRFIVVCGGEQREVSSFESFLELLEEADEVFGWESCESHVVKNEIKDLDEPPQQR